MESTIVDSAGFGDLTNLSTEKLQELETVLTSILALPRARDTYAQIIDGTPIHTALSDRLGDRIKSPGSSYWKGSIISGRTKPSDNAMQEYEKIRRTFAPQNLRIDLKVAQKYQNAPPNSRQHLLRLLEITAASVHALAGMIYASSHRDMDVKPPEPREGHYYQFEGTDQFYVNFYHTRYRHFEDYPFGLLNVVGYWAETELLGGVVLFERGQSNSEIINAFLHSQAADDAFQLSEKQLKEFSDLNRASKTAKGADSGTVIPFAKESDARTEFTFIKKGEAPLRIYKNEYDKQPVAYTPPVSHCVITQGDESDPRAARMEVMMKKAEKLIKEHERNQAPYTDPALSQSGPSFLDMNKMAKGSSSSSSSKDKSPSTDKDRSTDKNRP